MNSNNNKSNSNKYLGIVDKRYIRTCHGIVHGLGSTIALLLGNFIFVNRVLLGNEAHGSTTNRIFHACNLVASLTTALFFWNKVQSWQLSTTTMEEKGLTKKILQRFNQGRGVVTMLMYSLIPFVCSNLPHHCLESRILSNGLALTMVAGAAYCYYLIREYGAHLWLVYGMTPMALGISIFFHSEQSLSSFIETYPLAMDRFQKESSFIISCVQLGFMMYYLYSRNLVTKSTVQKICKTYHVTVAIIFLLRLVHDLVTYFVETPLTSAGSVIPWPMLIQPMLLSVAFSGRLLSVLKKTATTKKQKKQSTTGNKKTTHEPVPSIEQMNSSNLAVSSAPTRRGSSMRRRSSLSARIEFSCSALR